MLPGLFRKQYFLEKYFEEKIVFCAIALSGFCLHNLGERGFFNRNDKFSANSVRESISVSP